MDDDDNSAALAAYVIMGWLMLASGLMGWVIGRFA